MNESTINKVNHSRRCKVCKHEQRNEIEKQYIEGDSPYKIVSTFPELDVKGVYRHIKVFDLEKDRDNSTLAIVNHIIDRGDAANITITPGVLMDALKLRAKLKGEIVDRQEISNKGDDKSKSTEQLNAEIVELIDESAGSSKTKAG